VRLCSQWSSGTGSRSPGRFARPGRGAGPSAILARHFVDSLAANWSGRLRVDLVIQGGMPAHSFAPRPSTTLRRPSPAGSAGTWLYVRLAPFQRCVRRPFAARMPAGSLGTAAWSSYRFIASGDDGSKGSRRPGTDLAPSPASQVPAGERIPPGKVGERPCHQGDAAKRFPELSPTKGWRSSFREIDEFRSTYRCGQAGLPGIISVLIHAHRAARAVQRSTTR
jgi:hypothetical protein